MSRRFFEVSPGFGGSMGVGFGYSPAAGDVRVGLRVQPRLDQAYTLYRFGRVERGEGWITNCDTAIDFAYMLGTTDSIMVSYSDQTLLGFSSSTPLNRVFALNYQHRWER